MYPFAVGFIGVHSGIYMNVYDITPTGSISLTNMNQMVRILRTELLEPLQSDCEDFRFRSTMYDLQDIFGEAATVAISNGVAGSSVEMAIRTLACDSQDVIFRAHLDGEQHDVKLREEGSIVRLEQLFEKMGFI
jgi:hypothetical protein